MAHLRYTLPRSNSQLSLGAAVLPLTRGLLQKLLTSPSSAAPASCDQVIQSISITPKSHAPQKTSTKPAIFFYPHLFSLEIKKKGGKEKKSGEKSDRTPDPLSWSLTHFLLRIQSRTKTRNERIVFRRPLPPIILFFFLFQSWKLADFCLNPSAVTCEGRTHEKFRRDLECFLTAAWAVVK